MTTINLEEKLNGIDVGEAVKGEEYQEPSIGELRQSLEKLYEKAQVIRAYGTKRK